MSQPDEFYNFERALDELKLKEEELKRLVSEGEIRAFREGDTMRLRRADVENLKAELMGGEVVDLGSSGEELVFEDDADFEETGMATEEISDMDTLLEEDVEDVGEIELVDDEPEPEVVATAAPVRRAGASRQAAAEPANDGLSLVLALATAAVLLVAIPVALSVSSGTASDLAKKIAGMFGHDLG